MIKSTQTIKKIDILISASMLNNQKPLKKCHVNDPSQSHGPPADPVPKHQLTFYIKPSGSYS